MAVRQMEPKQLHARLGAPEPQRPALLDVRTEGEHQLVALPDSLLIPLHELLERADELEPLRGREVVVYCHHGVRSLSGAALLGALGFDACSLRGGIDLYSLTVDPSLPRY